MMYSPTDALIHKLDRAEQHIEHLEREVEAFLSKAPDRNIVDYDAETEKAFRSFHQNRLVHPALSIIAGETIYQIRSCLDHLVCALVLKDGGSPDYRTQFPIFRFKPTKNDEIARYNRQVKGIQRSPVLALIEGRQPYHRGSDRDTHWLTVLKTLSNTDKHRALILTVPAVEKRVKLIAVGDDGWEYASSHPDSGIQPPIRVTDPDGSVIEIVNMERSLTAKVAFAEYGPAFRNVELITGLRVLFTSTHTIFSELALYL